MKTLGLIGGMSWESTVPYYQLVNRGISARLGGHHSARLILYSVDFAEIERLQREHRWGEAGAVLADAAAALERAGAECIVLATNTMHCVAASIEAQVGIPLLHIADATGAAVKAAGLAHVGLLGTRFTMEQPFYRERLERDFGLTVYVPGDATRQRVHAIIYDELCHGVIDDTSRVAYVEAVEELVGLGAEGVILGCTEIGLLLGPEDVSVPLFDTTALHAAAAVECALE